MKFVSYKEESKAKNWGTSAPGTLSIEQIMLGATLRIADAAEKMASNYVALQNDCDMYKRWYEQEKKSTERLRRRNSALRGHITRLKKK